MARFVDKAGTEWKIVLDVGLIQEVKDELGINLSVNGKDSSWINAVLNDHSVLVNILYILCQDQIKELGLSPRDFGRRFTEEVLDKAGDALLETVPSFGRRSRIGQTLRDQMPKLLKKAEDEAIKIIQQKTAEAMEKPFQDSNSPTNSPALPE